MGGRRRRGVGSSVEFLPAAAAAAVAAVVAGNPWTPGWLTCIGPGEQQASLKMALGASEVCMLLANSMS